MAKSFLGKHSVRGLRNNNPGNLVITDLKWQGKISKDKNTDGTFEQFQSIPFGLRAMLKDLINDINKGKNTINKIISEYAPPHENDTQAYINSVSKSVGLSPNEKLTVINAPFLVSISRAILKVELGKPHILIEDADIIQAINMLGNISTNNLIVKTNTNFFF